MKFNLEISDNVLLLFLIAGIVFVFLRHKYPELQGEQLSFRDQFSLWPESLPTTQSLDSSDYQSWRL